jgi:hypothetical protein
MDFPMDFWLFCFESAYLYHRMVRQRNPYARLYGFKNLYPCKKPATGTRRLTKSIDFRPNYLCYFHLRGGEVVEGEGGAQLELSSLSQEQAANYTCAAVNTAGLGDAEAFHLEIYGMSMDQITIKTPNPKRRLYWCLIGFID